MSYRRIDEVAVGELLRRWHDGASMRRIARDTGIDRKTARRYVRGAKAMGVAAFLPLDGETVRAIIWVVRRRDPRVGAMQHALASQAGRIRAWLAARLSLARVHDGLTRAGLRVSYATLRRFAIRELGWRARRGTPRAGA